MKKVIYLLPLLLLFLCGKKEEAVIEKTIGVGPVKSVSLGENIDEALAAEGKALFEGKCIACHQLDKRTVGPEISGLTERRKPEWIMNMILNPVEMTQQDPMAKKLLEEYKTQMTFQNMTQGEARSMLEYFRKIDAK